MIQDSAPAQIFPACPACTDKIHVIDAMQTQIRDIREELSDVRDQLMIADARLSESRRVVDIALGYRS
jgi:hypothetical protein